MSASRPGSLMIPTFTGRSTVTRSPRSGMKAREGTPRKRLLSTIHAEYFGARSAICASLKRSRVLSKPCGKVCGGRWRSPLSRSSSSARRVPVFTRVPASASTPKTNTTRRSLCIISPYPLTNSSIPYDVRWNDRCASRHPPSRVSVEHPMTTRPSPSRKLVRRKLVGPELRPDLSDLVAPFLTQRVRRAQVFLASVVEHLEDLERRSLEQTDRAEVVRVGRLE